MSEPNDAPRNFDARLIELEMLFMHHQRTVADLDQVVLSQQRKIEALERRIQSLQGELGTMASALTPERKPEDEKPPHY